MDLYLQAVKPEGEIYFRRNLAAFWDAITAEGPGYPGACRLVIKNYKVMLDVNSGKFMEGLISISNSLGSVVNDEEITIIVMRTYSQSNRI